jgi:hypothetical protein
MQEAESRASVEPIDSLLDERAHLVEKAATLHGLHGTPMVWDAKRKALVMQIRHRLRGQYMAVHGGKRPTEAQLDEEAHADDDYVAFITETLTQRAEFYRLTKAIEAIDMRCNRGQALIRFVSSEVRT